MEYRALGRAGLTLSAIGLGAHMFPQGEGPWYPGSYGKRVREDVSYGERRAVMDAAIKAGVTLVAGEGGGPELAAETCLTGRLVRDLGARDAVLLLGVTTFRPAVWADVRWADLDAALTTLLEELETDRLDILEVRVHEALLASPFPAGLAAWVQEAKARGRIRATAAYTGDGPDDAILRAIASGAFDAVCRPLGFLNPGAIQRVLPAARDAGLGFIAFVPFQKGWLFECAREAGLMEDGGAAVARAALRWALGHPGVTSVLVGVASPGELDVNAGMTEGGPLTAAERDLLWRLVQTRAYDTYLERVKAANPHAAVDWRRGPPPEAL